MEQKALLARYHTGFPFNYVTRAAPGRRVGRDRAVKIVGDKVVAAGVSRTGQLFLVNIPEWSADIHAKQEP